jgi:hypothetical protein
MGEEVFRCARGLAIRAQGHGRLAGESNRVPVRETGMGWSSVSAGRAGSPESACTAVRPAAAGIEAPVASWWVGRPQQTICRASTRWSLPRHSPPGGIVRADSWDARRRPLDGPQVCVRTTGQFPIELPIIVRAPYSLRMDGLLCVNIRIYQLESAENRCMSGVTRRDSFSLRVVVGTRVKPGSGRDAREARKQSEPG